jgi:hypothetical protein
MGAQFMTTFQTQSTASTSENEISKHEQSYYQQRFRNRAFEEVLAFFAHRAEQENLTKRLLAKRLGKDPSQITRWFSGPSNWTLDTISDLLLAMRAELEVRVRPFEEITRHNYEHPLTREPAARVLGTKVPGRAVINPTQRRVSHAGGAVVLPTQPNRAG